MNHPAVPGPAAHAPALRASGTVLSLLWGIVLLWLAYLWIRSPFLGGWLLFGNWSLMAIPLGIASWIVLRRALPGLRVPTLALVAVGLAWIGAGWVAWSGIGPEWMLDGFILRDPLRRWGGVVLRWLPPVLALAVSVGGLSLALEARYRLARSGDGGAAAGGAHEATPPPDSTAPAPE